MIKLPKPNLSLINDIKHIDEDEIFAKIQTNTHFSLSFIVLLIGSTIVCTLGLLLNSTPIVIGGMIISPLMWPLLKISLGISYEQMNYIRQAIILLVFCIFFALLSSSVIAYVSPIKLLNAEILARTSPTLIDLVIALVAGGVAALGITQPRVSESLAGVAIATSLMPPLCVSGIGLALFDYSVFSGGFILFFANIISIIFISTLTFIFVGVKRHTESAALRTKGILFITVLLVITAIPLFFFLRTYSFKIIAYHRVHEVLSKSLKDISSSIFLESVKTDDSPLESGNILVDAQVWLPEDFTIDYQQRQGIIKSLETALERKIDLNLRLQRTISIVSKEDRLNEFLKKQLRNIFLEEIQKINSAFSVDSLEINLDEESQEFHMDVVLRGDPTISMTQKQRETLEITLQEKIGRNLSLNIEIISRIKLQSSPDVENQKIKQAVQKIMQVIFEDVDISYISLKTEKRQTSFEGGEKEVIIVELELKAPKEFEVPPDAFDYIKRNLNQQFDKEFIILLKVIENKSYRF